MVKILFTVSNETRTHIVSLEGKRFNQLIYTHFYINFLLYIYFYIRFLIQTRNKQKQIKITKQHLQNANTKPQLQNRSDGI